MKKITVAFKTIARSETPFEVTSYDKNDRRIKSTAASTLEEARKTAEKLFSASQVVLVIIDEQDKGPIEGIMGKLGYFWKLTLLKR